MGGRAIRKDEFFLVFNLAWNKAMDTGQYTGRIQEDWNLAPPTCMQSLKSCTLSAKKVSAVVQYCKFGVGSVLLILADVCVCPVKIRTGSVLNQMTLSILSLHFSSSKHDWSGRWIKGGRGGS